MVEPQVADVLARGADELGIERGFEFVFADLDPGDAIVIADAELLEAPRPEDAFGLLDPGEFLFGDFQAGRNTGGKAGHRRFVGDREVIVAGDLTNLVFGDVVFEQW